jgi:dTDP-4-dehydrorhamnose 3,5-epimerase
MSFQHLPHGEVKVIGCPKDAIWNIMIDLRPQSPTHRHWRGGFGLTAENRRQLYVPEAFQTLCDDTEVVYLFAAFYEPDGTAGMHYDDEWPLPLTVISAKDETWPDFFGSQPLVIVEKQLGCINPLNAL